MKTTGTAAIALAGASPIAMEQVAAAPHISGGDILKVGLVGCGGRGTGAAADALGADPNARLTAMADVFPKRAEQALERLATQEIAVQLAVEPDHCFDGFDGYQKVLDSGVDVILLAAPPHFRPRHLEAAIKAGVHVFCEKPVATDAPGVRSVLATCEAAKEKNLSIVSGLCWRYHPTVQEVMKRVQDGAIGDIVSIQENYLAFPPKRFERSPEDTEMMYQIRNWDYFTWLCGDNICEQHVHSLDKALWLMNDEPPQAAWGTGGRQTYSGPECGDRYDHHAVVFEYPGNVHVHSYCRQQLGCAGDTSDMFFGTKGTANVLKFRIEGENPWRARNPESAAVMYDCEHEALFKSIRSGEPINNGLYMARSTMMAILGRMASYTGKKITWDDALASEESFTPSGYSWNADPPTLPGPDGNYPIPMPGLV